MWQEEPLQGRRPVSVQVLTAEYRKDSDAFARFVEDCLVVDPEAWIASKRLVAAYREWCRTEGIQYPLGPRSLWDRLRRLGATDKKRGERGWQGVGEKPRASLLPLVTLDSTDSKDSSVTNPPIDGHIGEFADQLSPTVQLSRPEPQVPLLAPVAGRSQLIPETRRPSGRAVAPHERRPLTTDFLQLDAAKLKRLLRTPAPALASLTWPAFEERHAALLLPRSESNPQGIALVQVPFGEDALVRAIAERLVGSPLIPLRWTRCHFGGRRAWFACLPCGRRSRLLYKAPGDAVWLCRLCVGATYESRRRHRERFFEGIDALLRTRQRIARDLRSRSPRRRQRGMAELARLQPAALLARTWPRLRSGG